MQEINKENCNFNVISISALQIYKVVKSFSCLELDKNIHISFSNTIA